MKKKNDFSHDNAFFGADRYDFERVELPELSDVVVNKEERKNSKRVIYILLLIFSITLLICVMIFAFCAPQKEIIEVSLPTEQKEEWRGAFNSREIYEDCIECSVSIKVGKGKDVRRWSGVILSSDGWIATDNLMIGDADEGRIFVTLSDGREYGAESIIRDSDSGTAVLKISAEGLRYAELSEKEVQSGQTVIIVSAGQNVINGSASVVADSLRLNAQSDGESQGAPVFDIDGYLIGISVGNESKFACGADVLNSLAEDLKNKY